MNEKQKTHHPIQQPASASDPGGDDLAVAQAQMSTLLAAGDAAISAALSGDSEAFLNSTRQRGGQ